MYHHYHVYIVIQSKLHNCMCIHIQCTYVCTYLSYVSVLLVHRVKTRVAISELNPANLPPPKDLTEEMPYAENETVLRPTRPADRIASTPGGNCICTCIRMCNCTCVANNLNAHANKPVMT